MKLTNTQNVKATKSGMTLLELTVVILVLLSLISILFIGARAWKKGSDRAASILQIRNVQQAVRSYSNMNGLNPGGAMVARPTSSAQASSSRTIRQPALTRLGGFRTYTIAAPTVIPAIGTLYMTASDPEYAPTAGTTGDW